ncbi:MAG: hypothetical protein ACC619_07135 [Paracoccaceae bacterium]
MRTEASSEMWADATHFHITARIGAFESDQLIFERDFLRRIRRDLV